MVSVSQPVLTEADDDWHDHSPHWWETQTAWFTFNVPERRMCGSLYVKARSAQQTCDGGAWVWDGSPPGALSDVQPAEVMSSDIVRAAYLSTEPIDIVSTSR
jgi:hypothetical protein